MADFGLVRRPLGLAGRLRLPPGTRLLPPPRTVGSCNPGAPGTPPLSRALAAVTLASCRAVSCGRAVGCQLPRAKDLSLEALPALEVSLLTIVALFSAFLEMAMPASPFASLAARFPEISPSTQAPGAGAGLLPGLGSLAETLGRGRCSRSVMLMSSWEPGLVVPPSAEPSVRTLVPLGDGVPPLGPPTCRRRTLVPLGVVFPPPACRRRTLVPLGVADPPRADMDPIGEHQLPACMWRAPFAGLFPGLGFGLPFGLGLELAVWNLGW
jgi:hypothetical protein